MVNHFCQSALYLSVIIEYFFQFFDPSILKYFLLHIILYFVLSVYLWILRFDSKFKELVVYNIDSNGRIHSFHILFLNNFIRIYFQLISAIICERIALKIEVKYSLCYPFKMGN